MADLMETTPDVLERQKEKFQTRNPIAKALLSGFNKSLVDLIRVTGAERSLEVGCGEGEILRILIDEGANPYGVDINEEELAHARNELDGKSGFRGADYGNVYELTSEKAEQLVVCCEVLEHLGEPEKAVEILAELADPWLLLSVPREPIWRAMNMARGKYLSDWGNTPSHINHWSSGGFQKLVSAHIPIVEVRHPLPWTMILARKP